MNESLLVNTLGHSAGVLIFGIFLYLLIQDRAARRLRGSTKSMLAAALALAWNLTSLVVLGLGNQGGLLANLTATIGFCVLSLLPAVLFDLCLQDRYPLLVGLGYGLSGVSVVLHVVELFRQGSHYHLWGLELITIGYGALTCVAAAGLFASRDQHRHVTTSRLVGTMLLFLLAMSFVHFATGDAVQVWSRELFFHHAAIPLALLLLLQDYRFILLDAFLRFLANGILAAGFTFAAVEAWNLGWLPRANTPFHEALILAGACMALIVFALVRGSVQKALTRVAFRRSDQDSFLAGLKTPVREEGTYLLSMAGEMGKFMGAEASEVEDARLLELDLRRPALVSELPRYRAELEQKGVEAVVPLRIPSGGSRHVLLGRRSGGRRYLSEDLQALGRAAGQIVEQVEEFRETEMKRLVTQAELRALQSQIHPHFLFNALNTLYGIIPREARGARETVLNLAEIFRYFLETEKSFLPLEEELRIVRAYLEVERLRLGDKLHIRIEADPEALHVAIPILSIQPLVENAVKHGISPKPGGGWIQIEARLDGRGALNISVTDTGGGFPASSEKTKSGVGLENVIRRLQLCYGAEGRFDVRSDSNGSTVSFTIPAPAPAAARMAEA